MRLGIIMIMATIFPALQSGAQGVVVPRHVLDSIANPPMMAISALVFDSADIDVGDLSEDDAPKGFAFTFSNNGDKPLVITRAEASCGCVVTNFSKEPVKPGGKGKIGVTFNPRGRAGKVHQRVYVFTNTSETHSTARLTLSGEVASAGKWSGYPAVMGDLRAKRSTLTFREVTRSTRQTERIECVNSGQKPLRITTVQQMTPDWLSLSTEPEVIEPGQTADLVVTVDGSKLRSDAKFPIEHTQILDGLDARPSQRSLRIIVDVKEN